MQEETTVPTPAAAMTFETVPYKPDGQFAWSSLFQFIAGLSVIGVILGVALWYISQFFWMIILFPIAIGMVVGFLGSLLIRKTRIRNPWVCALAGLLAGVFAMAAMHFTSYRAFEAERQQAVPEELLVLAREIDQFQAERDQLPQETRDVIEELESNPLFLQYLQVQSFPEYLDYVASLGVTISRSRKEDDLNLGYAGSWIYWGLEALIVAGISLYVMKSTAADPFCAASNQWKTAVNYGVLPHHHDWLSDWKTGRITPVDWSNHEIPWDILVTVYSSPEFPDTEPIDVFLNQMQTNAKGETSNKNLVKLRFPGEAHPLIRAFCTVPATDDDDVEESEEEPLDDVEEAEELK